MASRCPFCEADLSEHDAQQRAKGASEERERLRGLISPDFERLPYVPGLECRTLYGVDFVRRNDVLALLAPEETL